MITGNKPKKEGSAQYIEEVAIAGDAGEVVLVFGMEGIKQRAGDQVRWPNHSCWPNQESAAHAGEAESGELSGDGDKGAEPVVDLEIIVHLCVDDNTKGVWRANRYISHDVDENVFFDIPWSGVQ